MRTKTIVFMEVPTAGLTVPLRYYKGWKIEFDVDTESFQSPFLCLFKYPSAAQLEKAIDEAIIKRNQR